MIPINTKQITDFREIVWNYFATNGRGMPWRNPGKDGSFDIYKILVSEFMLQQTQVGRVIPKFQAFLESFPNIQALARAGLSDVLRVWSGLGYNRRAKYLHDAAKTLLNRPEPWSIEDLVSCKGIGSNTAVAILVYAYDKKLAFIETNIRTVYIHHFFAGKTAIPDKDILTYAAAALPEKDFRRWHWALMDYGAHLKATNGNAAVRAKSYSRQSKFAGSKRELRGRVLRELAEKPLSAHRLHLLLDDERVEGVCNELAQEGLISASGSIFSLG